MYRVLIVFVMIAAVFFAGVLMEKYSTKQAIQKAQLEAAREAIEQANEQLERDLGIIRSFVEEQAQSERQQQVIVKEVVRHVATNPDYTDCRIDPYGMCLIEAAVNGTPAEDCADRSYGAVPSSGGS